MASIEQTFSTSDLRSHSIDYKRDETSKAKWAHGGAWKTGRFSHQSHPAPIKAPSRYTRSDKQMGLHAAKVNQKFEIMDEQLTSDSSADEEVVDPESAAGPDGTAEVAYSFDAVKGPSQGSQILSLAVAKAVERYETKVTDNIVNKEWEVLDEAGEVLPKPTATGKKHVKHAHNASVDMDAEYEFV